MNRKHDRADVKIDPPVDLIERLAELEHEQWRHWSQAVAADVPAVVRTKWQRSWVSYADLSEELKEADRIWARKVAAGLRDQKLIP